MCRWALRLVFGSPLGPAELGRALVIVLASVPVLAAMGALFACLALRFQDSQGVIEIIRAVCLLLCGVAYPLAVLPRWARVAGRALPPTHIIDGLRQASLQPMSLSDLAERAGALLGTAAVISLFAAWALHRALAQSRRTGKLGQF